MHIVLSFPFAAYIYSYYDIKHSVGRLTIISPKKWMGASLNFSLNSEIRIISGQIYEIGSYPLPFDFKITIIPKTITQKST